MPAPHIRLGADVVLPWDGRDHYLAGIYRTALADRVAELVAAGERSMRALVEPVDTQRIVMAEQPALTNVNTAADLEPSIPPQLPSKFNTTSTMNLYYQELFGNSTPCLRV